MDGYNMSENEASWLQFSQSLQQVNNSYSVPVDDV